MKLHKDYNKVIDLLKKEYGWSGLDCLTEPQIDLINDVIKASKKRGQKAKIDKNACPHAFVLKGEIFRCKLCNTTMGTWILASNKKQK